MPTTYTVTFDEAGWIISVQSWSNGNDRKDIRHPVLEDTFVFMNAETARWKNVKIESKTPGVDSTALFGTTSPTVSTPKSPIHYPINYNGPITALFAFTPLQSSTSDEDADRDPEHAPPDTGTIKVGG